MRLIGTTPAIAQSIATHATAMRHFRVITIQ
jgi:hypothetical protein